MLSYVSHFMNPSQIYALPQHINSSGELVVYAKDFAQLMDITPATVETTRLQVLYGLFADENDSNLFIPETITLREAVLIAEAIS